MTQHHCCVKQCYYELKIRTYLQGKSIKIDLPKMNPYIDFNGK